MDLSIPVLVSVDHRDQYELMIPGLTAGPFRGPSLATLLDDVALHLMEKIPAEQAENMTAYELCPLVELRKVKITAQLPGETKQGGKKELIPWTGRLAVVLTRWPEDDYHLICVPRLGPQRYPLANTGALEAALESIVKDWAEAHGRSGLDSRTCRPHEYLEILNYDADLPTVLPSKPLAPKKKKKKKGAAAKKKAEEKKLERKKRQLVAPLVLRTVATNLTHRAIDGRLGRAYLRDSLVKELTEQLEHEGSGILLVGPSGVGKTALVHEVVRRLADDSRFETLRERRDVWQVDGNRLISGMSVVGAWEHRVGSMVRELSLRQDILYVNDLPALVYTGRSAHSDTNVADYLTPHLARGDLRIIGECTPERLLATRDEAPGFFARFRIVQLPELSEKDALLVLVHLVRELGAGELLRVEPAALESVLALTRRFEANRVHPGKAVTLLQRVLSDHTEVKRDELGRRVIDRAQVIDSFARQAGLPKFVLWEKESRAFSEIENYFSERIVAQPKAVEAAVDVVALLEQGLNDPSRPLSTFLFVGPTGVGKTETAKALAELLFGSPDRMIRFDMSELLHPDSVARLFGDRSQPDGELTRRVQQQPFSVVLLDEIEKAHPAIFDALLQVLGEGRLTNAAGRTVDFTNTVIIMTSNLGVREAGRHLGFENESSEALDTHYRSAAEKYFRPEFFNRIDRVVPFSPLGREAIAPLTARLLASMLGRRGLQRSSIVVDVDPELVDLIVEEGFDPRYGARSIKRVLEQKLAVPLAQQLITHRGRELTIVELFPRGDTIGMSLIRPRTPQVEAAGRSEPIADWAAVEALHARLTETVERILGGPELEQIRHEHSELVRQYAGRDLSEGPEDDRLHALADIVVQLTEVEDNSGDPNLALQTVLEEFRHQYLDLPDFEESIVNDDRFPSPKRDRGWWKKTKTLVAPEARPIRAHRGPLRGDTVRQLEGLEMRVGALLFRIRAALAPPSRPALLRFLPVSSSGETRLWANTLANEFDITWGTYGGTTRLFVRLRGEPWTLLEPGATLRHETLLGVAVEIAGPGMLELVRSEIGYYLDTVELGAEASTRLVRVDEVGDGSEPIARLSALDRALEAFRRERRTHDVADPLPALEVRRWFRGNTDVDPETGVQLFKDALCLYEVAMRRIVALRKEER